MSQAIFTDINPSVTSGNQLATLLNGFKDAVASGFSGTSRPANLQAGGYWVDVTDAGSPNFLWYYKMYTGSADITVFTLNIQTNTVSIAGSNNTFAVTRISADTVGAIFEIKKERVLNNGQVLDGDTVGELQFKGKDSTGAYQITAKIAVLATDNFTGSAYGSAVAFSAVDDGTGTLSEVFRFLNKRLGIGLVSPTNTLHVRGTGIKTDRLADDAVGAKIITKKARITGTGATQNNDIIGGTDHYSTDDATADLLVAKTEVVATEAHTSSAGGVQWILSIVKNTTTTLVQKILVGTKIQLKEGVSIEALELEQQDVATAATISSLSASKSIVAFTGSTATSLQGIDASGNCKAITIHNKSTADVVVKHADAGASASNRFDLPNGRDITIGQKSSAEFFYSTSESRWKVKSGAGSGSGGGYIVTSTQTVTAGGTITTTTVDQRQLRLVKGDTGGVDASTTPFGSGGGWIDGTEITLIGTDDDDYLTLAYNDAAKGIIGNIPSAAAGGLTLTKGRTATFIYSTTLDRFIYGGI